MNTSEIIKKLFLAGRAMTPNSEIEYEGDKPLPSYLETADGVTLVSNRPITLYEISIPREKFKERKFYNVFKYNSETDSVVALI